MTVDKNQFLTLLMRYSGTSLEEAERIIALKSTYPYSQLLQSIAAKVSKDHQLSNHELILQEAAIHASDRSVLKEIISTEFESSSPTTSILNPEKNTDAERTPTETIQERRVESITVVTESAPVEKPTYLTYEPIDGVDIADQVLRDLETLNTLKHNFEMMFVEYTEVKPVDKQVRESTSVEKAPAAKSEKSKDSAKSRKERIVEMAKALQNPEPVENKEAPRKKQAVKGHAQKELIDEIAITKKEIAPENQRQKEQIDIINQFIKISPSISSARDRQPPPSVDLNTVKSGEFGDNIVSETLVEILVKQGKKDKAVEVLKKLIWKYPQKKAYFASQIEDLKK
jgi:hypothetical protein